MKEKCINTNGIDIYDFTNDALHSFSIGVFIKAGSMYEPDELNGISHLFEHCVFRNIKRKYDTDFYELLTQHGLSFYGRTYREFINFEIFGTPSGLDFAVDMLPKIFETFSLPGAEFRAEKKRIKAEIRENDERSSFRYFLNSKIWEGTKLQKTITGLCKNLDRISLKKLNDYIESIMIKGNIFLYLTGNIPEVYLSEIKNVVSIIPVSEEGNVNDNTAPVPNAFCHREIAVSIKPSDWYYIGMAFDIDNLVCPISVRHMIYEILFSEENAMFHQYLSERTPMVYSFDSTLEQYSNVTNMRVRFEVDRKDIVPAVREAVRAFNDLKAGNFNFDNNLKKLLNSWEIMQDNVSDLNWCMAYENHILTEMPMDYEKLHYGRYEKITKEQIMECAKSIFRSSNIVFAMKGDKKHISVPEIKEALAELDC